MPSSLPALGLSIALTFGGSPFVSPPPDGDTDAPATAEDPSSGGAYLVATMALLGLAGLAGITRRDYVRARRRGVPVESASPSPGSAISPSRSPTGEQQSDVGPREG